MNRILSGTEEGIDLTAYYETRKKFMREQRKLLVKLIVNYLVSLKKRASKTQINDISRQISVIFPTEDKVCQNILTVAHEG